MSGGGSGMSTVIAARHPYIQALLSDIESTRGGASWLNERRSRALERANALTVPTTRDEEWRFTDIAPLTRLRLRRASAIPGLTRNDIAPFLAPEATTQLVFVDGVYVPGLGGVRIEDMVEVTEDGCRPMPRSTRDLVVL